MAADTSQGENQETFEVSLISHTPHLLYKLTPAQVQTCPLDTKKTVFFAPPYLGEDKLPHPSTLAGATVGVATSYKPVKKQERFLECLEKAWGSLDIYCVYTDYFRSDKQNAPAIHYRNRPTAAFYPLQHAFKWNHKQFKAIEKINPSIWETYHKAKTFKETTFYTAIKEYNKNDSLPWDEMIDQRLRTNANAEPTLHEKAAQMRNSKWVAQQKASPRWYSLWRARDKTKAATEYEKELWEINFLPIQSNDKQILNLGASESGGLLLLTNDKRDFADFPLKKKKSDAQPAKEDEQQAYCCIAPFNVRVRIDTQKAEEKGLQADCREFEENGKRFDAWVYSAVPAPPRCQVLALCCDWQNRVFYDAEITNNQATDTIPIATSFFYPENEAPLNKPLAERLENEEKKLVPKPEFCLFDRTKLAVSTKNATVGIKWRNPDEKIIQISKQEGSPVAFPVKTYGAWVYAIVAIPTQFSNLQEIKVSAKCNDQSYLTLDGSLMELPGSNGSGFSFEGKPEKETYKLCLAKMKFVHDVTSDTAEQTGLLHQGQLKLDWTFIYERGSGKKMRASINVTGEYSTTCVDYVMVFGDSKLHIPVNQYTDLRSTCDVTDFAQSVPICISAYKAFYKRIHNNEAFKKAMQQKCSDNPYINVYTTMAFGIALSREYKGNYEVYSLKKSPLVFNINKLFKDLSNPSYLKMRCEEEAVTFTVFARLLGKKDINIVCSPNHAWVETSPGKCKYDISTFVPNDNPNDDTHMEIDELSELSGLKTEHDPIILK